MATNDDEGRIARCLFIAAGQHTPEAFFKVWRIGELEDMLTGFVITKNSQNLADNSQP